MNDIDKMPPKCRDCPYWERAAEPYVCSDRTTPVKKCGGDYILRSDALEIATEWCPDDDGSVGKVGDLREMLDELESIPAADVEPKRKWISVKSIDDLPERTMVCLVACDEPGKDIERIALYINGDNAFFEYGNDITVYVTHWMQLPEPPKGEDDAEVH